MIAGWDWSGETHDVSVIDADGRLLEHRRFVHTEAGLTDSLRFLRRFAVPEELPVAVELTTGLVIDRLFAAGHPVYPVHPRSFNAARPRWGSAKSKSDRADSYQLADYVRTDMARLNRLVPMSLAARELRALSRARDDQVEARKRALRQLKAVLETYWPGPLQLFSRLDTQIAMQFLDDYPTPEAAARLGAGRMALFLSRNRYPGSKTAGELVERLRSAPVAAAGLDPAVLAGIVHAHVRVVRTLAAGVADLSRAVEAALTKHPKTPLLATLPRVGRVNLGQIMGEVGPILERAKSVDQLAAEAGAVPVTRESGKVRGVSFRWTVNSRARKALDRWADNSRKDSPWAQEVYLRALQRGKRHPHAIRILTRAWLRVVWACWHTDTPYDPARHGAIQRRAEVIADAA